MSFCATTSASTVVARPFDVQVFRSALHCDGVRANVAIPRDATVLTEKPLLRMQSVPNRQHCLCCSQCLRFIGSAATQLLFLSKVLSRESIQSGLLAGECAPTVDFLDALPSSPDITLCANHCGEFYCSAMCRDAHWRTSHQLLCTGLVSDEDAVEHPLVRFKVHAVQTNEIFLLVADVFASVCLQREAGYMTSNTDAVGTLEGYEGYVRNQWHDCVVASKKSSAAKLRKTLIRLTRESWQLLSQALSLKRRGLEGVLTEEYFSRTIGMFEQNNVGIRLENPLVAAFTPGACTGPLAASMLQHLTALVDSLDDDDCCEEGGGEEDEDGSDDGSDGSDGDASEEEERVTEGGDKGGGPGARISEVLAREGVDRLFPPLDGAAFYLAVCKANHSCAPNVYVRYDCSTAHGVCASLVAIRDISAGEELLQSYIDQSMPVARRQAALRDYGFVCGCERCATEVGKTA